MTRRAAIYTRISQDPNGTHLGVDRQREDCDAYAARHGWEVVETYVDNDFSATSGKRPNYQRMLADIEAGKVDAVIVWALDRLHRRPVELEGFIDLADRHHLALGSVGGEVDLGTSSGRLHARIMGGVARHEVEHKSERQTRAALQAAQQGRATGGPRPFGYQVGGMKLDPIESRELRKMYDAILAGSPLREISRDLNARNVTTIYGKQWSATQVRAVLLRPRAAGLRSYRGEVIGPAQWPAVVSEDTWRATVGLLTSPGRRTSPGFAKRWLLSSIALCGVCGDTVSSAGARSTPRGDGHRVTHYRCRSRKHIARNAERVDELVQAAVVARLARPDAIDLLVDRHAPDTDALRAEAQMLRTRLDSLAVDFADGSLTSSQLRAATERLRSRLRGIEQRQAHVTRAPVLADVVGAKDVQARWDGLSFERKRAVIDAVMRVTIMPAPLNGARVFNRDLIRLEPKD